MIGGGTMWSNSYSRRDIQSRDVVYADDHEWLYGSIKKARKLLDDLKAGWAGTKSLPPTIEAFQLAIFVLEGGASDEFAGKPFVAPLESGGFQIEWYNSSNEVAVEISADGQSLCIYRGSSDGSGPDDQENFYQCNDDEDRREIARILKRAVASLSL